MGWSNATRLAKVAMTGLVSGVVLVTGVVVPVGVAQATNPVFTKWPSDYAPLATESVDPIYARLYMLSQTSPYSVPVDITDVPIDGTMEFTGLDPIAGVQRDIEVATDDPAACVPSSGNNYDVGPCPRVMLDLTGGDVAGGIRFGDALTPLSGNRFLHSGGAVIDVITNAGTPDAPQRKIEFNGRDAALNDALADLIYETGPDYKYDGTNGVTLTVGVNSDDTSTLTDGKIEIRVLDVNQFPDVTGPDDKGTLQPQVEFKMPADPADPAEFTVADVDNDEDVDNDAPDPPCPADDSGNNAPDGCDDPVDGPGTDMLLFGYMTCGSPIVPGTGFHYASSTFPYDPPSLDDLFTDYLAGTPAGLPEVQTFLAAIQAVFDAIDPNLWTMSLASGSPTDYTNVFAGITTMSEVQDALSQVTVRHDVPDDTCHLYTIVSDLGNNGLPLQYIVTDPTDYPGTPGDEFGWELPFLGLDVQDTVFGTSSLPEIDVSFDASPLYFDEATGPDTATAVLHVSPAQHPEFTIKWDANPKLGDVIGPGQATPNGDFMGTYNNTLTIPADATTVVVNAPSTTVYGDTDVEGNETFTFDLVLSEPNPLGWVVTSTTPSRTVVIVDDDDAPASVTAFDDESTAEGDPGDSNVMTFTIGLDKPADGGETVDVALTDGSATSPADYGAPAPTTVTLDPGATSATFEVPIVGDLLDEGDHTFTATLSSPTGGLTVSDATATGTIIDDDLTRTASIGDASVLEGDSGTTALDFTVSLDVPAKGTESLLVNTADDTATIADSDYDALTNVSVTFAAGQQTKHVLVTVHGDTAVETDEQMKVQLTPVAGVAIGDGEGVGTITNDDGVIGVSIDDPLAVVEGDAGTSNIDFTVTLAAPAVGGEQIHVATSDGTATIADNDYVAKTQGFTFAPGESTKTFTVVVNGDTDVEPDEMFDVTLSGPVGLIVTDGAGVGTITNDDVTPDSVISIQDVTVAEPAPFAFVPIANTYPSRACQVAVTTGKAGDSAAAGSDYAAIAGAFFSANGVDDLMVGIVDDFVVEPDETFTVTLSLTAGSDPGCVLGDAEATVTIQSDDVYADVSIADAVVTEATGDTDAAVISMTNWVAGLSCSLAVSSADGTATAPDDYDAVGPGAVFLLAGSSDVLALGIQDDAVDDDAETFTVSMTLTAGADPRCRLDPVASSATVLIVDNDGATDTTPPTVTVEQAASQSDPTSSSPIQFTVVFSEPVFGFDGTDVTVGGTAGATTANVSGSGPTYTIAVSGMTTSGTVTASVGAGRVVDGAGWPNAASTSTDNSVQYDKPVADLTPPSVTVEQAVGQPDPTSVAPVHFTVQFSEPVTGFATGDVTLGGTAGATSAVVTNSGDDMQFVVAVSGMTASGSVIASVAPAVAQDLAGNDNTASTSFDNTVQYAKPAVDSTAPTVTIDQAAGQADPTASTPILFTAVFSEPVTGFDGADVMVTGTAGATTVNVSGSGASYTVSVSGMVTGGTVIVSIPAGAAVDAATNASLASTSTDDTVTYTPSQGSPGSPLTISVPGNIVVDNDPGQAGATVPYPAPTATGGIPPVTVTCDHASGAFYPIGTTTVNCTADDAGAPLTENLIEATSTGSFTITVIDAEPPQIAQPPDLTRTATSSSGAAVAFTLPTATDNAGTPTVTCAPVSGSTFAIGSTTVTCTAIDAAGLTASASFRIIVVLPAAGLPATGSAPGATTLAALVLLFVGVLLRSASRRRTPASRRI